MKKTLFGGIAALSLIAVLASGCARETVESKSDKQTKFTTVVGKQTRASEFIYWNQNDQITVWAFGVGGTALFKEFTLTFGGGGFDDWDYGTPVPQPGVPLVFYSFYPEDNVTETLDGTSGSLAYVVQDEANQEDLIATTATTDSHLVALNFEHLLSQINFAIMGIDSVQVEVTNITLSGIADAGTYTFGSGWDTPTGNATYVYTAAGAEMTDGTSAILCLGNRGGGDPANNANDNALMLMPQQFDTASVSFVSFDYEIFDMDDVSLESGSESIDLSTLGTTLWDAGKRYIYVIDFSGDDIIFYITVSPWTDGNIIDVQP